MDETEGKNTTKSTHLSHSGVISLVGIQFVLNQLGQGGVVLVLADRMTDRWMGGWTDQWKHMEVETERQMSDKCEKKKGERDRDRCPAGETKQKEKTEENMNKNTLGKTHFITSE